MEEVVALSDERFAQDIQKLLRDLEEFKQFQRSGQDSIRMYRIFSANSSDKSLTSVGTSNKRFRLIFTPNEGEGRGLVYKMVFTYTEGTGSSVSIRSEREKVNEDGSQTWLFAITGSDASPNSLVEFKFYFWSSGDGSFTIVDL